MGVWLITGEVHAGKTSFLERFLTLCRENGIRAGGFLVTGEFVDNRRDRLRLLSVATGQSVEMATLTPRQGWIIFRKFYFNPEAFTTGKEIIREGLLSGTGIMVLDEVGPMELEGGGWHDSLDEMASASGTESIWAVRESICRDVRDKWGVPDERILSITRHSPELLLTRILGTAD